MRYRNVARGEPQRRKVISRWGSYHGGTVASAALGGGRDVHDAFALPMDDFLFVSQPNWPVGAEPGESESQFVDRLIAELERTIETAGPDTIAGFVAEPISFSCGFFPPPAGYFDRVREVLDRHGILFLDDEGDLRLWPHRLPLRRRADGPEARHHDVGQGHDQRLLPGLGHHHRRRALRLAGARAASSAAPSPMPRPLRGIRSEQRWRWRCCVLSSRTSCWSRCEPRIPTLHRHLQVLADHPLVSNVRTFGLAGGVTLTAAKIKGSEGMPATGGVAMMGAVGKILGRVMLDHGLIVRVTGDNAVIAPPLIIQDTEIEELFRRFHAALDDTAAELART